MHLRGPGRSRTCPGALRKPHPFVAGKVLQVHRCVRSPDQRPARAIGLLPMNPYDLRATREEVEARRKTFVRKWRLKHRAVADSLQEAGDRLFAFTHLPPSQWRSVRTTNAIERLHEELKRRIKTQTVLPSVDTAAMLFWALLASGQMNMRKVDGWQTLATKPIDQPIDLAA